MEVLKLKIPEYTFNSKDNPYSFDLKSPNSIDGIARIIELSIKSEQPVLVRGLQSGKHALSRDDLINSIKESGADYSYDGKVEIYAAPFETGFVENILEGFHKWKPKCLERPQYPVDIWMIYELDAFDNIEYMHPRLKVIAKDKWKLKKAHKNSLLKLVIVN